MADETEDQPVAPVAPPAQPIVPRGTGYTYSTPGPANWQQPRTVSGPQGMPVQIPQNAQNFASVVGPPPEDQETAAFRKMFNSLPMDQAIKAYQAAKQFQGQRVLQTKLAGYNAAGLPPDQALGKALTDAAAVGLFSGAPKEMMGLQHNLALVNSDKARQQFEARKMALDAAAQRQASAQQFRQKMVESRGAMTGIDTDQIRALERQQDRAQAAADRLEAQLPITPGKKPKAEMQATIKTYKDTVDNLQKQIDGIRVKYQAKPVTTAATETDSLQAPVTAAAPPKPLDRATAAKFFKDAKGDKAKARQMAKDAGYTF